MGTSILNAQKVYIVQEKEHDVYFENSGRVEAIKRATISAETTGVVRYLGANVSENFKKGDTLVKLSSVYQNAKVKEAKQDLANAKLDLAEKKRKYYRIQKLKTKHLAKNEDVTAKKTAYDQAKRLISKKKEKLVQLQELASYTKIVAPFDAVVEKRHVRRAEKISLGQKLYTIYNKEKIRVVVNVPESMLKMIKKHQKVYVEVEKQSFYIDFKNIIIFPTSYNYAYTLRIVLPKAISPLFHDGNFVNVKFKIGTEKAIYLDNKYLHKQHETMIVYIKKGESIHAQYVRLGESYQNQSKILSGLEHGDSVVENEK